jgi:hypothetical protein
MKALTKMAVERAEIALKRKVEDRMNEWDRKNPQPESGLSLAAAVELAVGDPEWRKALVRRAVRRDGYSDLSIGLASLRDDSAKVRAEHDKIEKRNEEHKRHRAAEASRWFVARNALLDRAMIGSMTPEELLAAVNAF